MKDLFSIGELSKHQNISRQTLIFYDKIGLFHPAYVDPENGYRYYSSKQLDDLDTICIMKKIGFSLDEIKAHMKSYTLDTSVAALRKQLTIIERRLQELQLIKSRVEHRCLQLEQSASVCSSVSVENVSPQYILLQEVSAPYTLEMVSMATKNALSVPSGSSSPFSFKAVRSCLLNAYVKADTPKLPMFFCPLKNVLPMALLSFLPDNV